MINIIPKPVKLVELDGEFTINAKTTYTGDKTLLPVMDFLNEYLTNSIGSTLKESKDGDIVFVLDQNQPKEGYKIGFEKDKMLISASAYEGAFYAVQTIRQVFGTDTKKGVKELTAAKFAIEDYPRFSWRAMLFDEGRHFFGESEVKRLIDIMALHKLNTLHWHLTDDQGWRIEIKKYPLLTQIGSKRVDTNINGWKRDDREGKPHEGFYTQEQIKDIVEYAANRAIMIVPEIDMPAHFAAALAGYNWLGCRDIPCEVPWYFGGYVPLKEGKKDWNRPACPSKDTTYQFIYDVIDECAELFPAPYFHIGGDETPKEEWKVCPTCQKFMKEQGLKNVDDLQGYFTNKVYEYIKTKNKRLIGWNEILRADNLDTAVIAQYWVPTRDRNVERYINNGGQVIMSKHHAFYFDMCYSQYPLKNTYKFEPVFHGIKRESEKNVLGVEGALWTEWIGDRLKMDVSLFPRMEALCEVGWTPKSEKNYEDFLRRLEKFKEILTANKVWYAEDEVSMPKGFIKRQKDMYNWTYKFQDMDVKYNKEARKRMGKPEIFD